MIEATLRPVRRPSPLRLGWVGSALLRPKETFAHIAAETRAIWITPMILLSLTALMNVAATGWLKGIASASGEVRLPPDFQYYSPEQQAQIMQALQATSGPVFLYVFPALLALMTVWIGWLLMSGLVHLALTMVGGRGATATTLNLVAWAGLPLLFRDLVRVGAMLSTRQLLDHPGLSGFAPPGSGGAVLFLANVLMLLDAYLIWHLILMVIGARAAGEISTGKAFMGITLTTSLAIAFRAGLASAVAFLGTLTVIRPFFF
jgi:hypothetical protein